MKSDLSIVALAASGSTERPLSQNVIDFLKKELRRDAAANRIRASAIVYDVKLKASASGANSDAIAISLDHVDGYSVIVAFPYALDGSNLNLGVPLSSKSASEIFSP
jgi:hypothetical protein